MESTSSSCPAASPPNIEAPAIPAKAFCVPLNLVRPCGPKIEVASFPTDGANFPPVPRIPEKAAFPVVKFVGAPNKKGLKPPAAFIPKPGA